MADNSLAQAIDEAAAQILEETGSEVPESTETETSEESTEEGTETTEEEPEDKEIKNKERQEADTLYAALKDPKTRLPVLYAMMAEAGIKFPGSVEEKPPTEKEVQATKKATLDIMKEALGKDFEFLASKLTTALDTILEQERAELSTLRGELDTNKLVTDSKAAEAKLNAETKGDFKKYEARITELIDLYPPGPKISVEDYLRGLYVMASAGKTVAKTKGQVADRIRQNSNDSAGRLRAQATPSGDGKTGTPSFRGKGALGKSVEYALQQMAEKNK